MTNEEIETITDLLFGNGYDMLFLIEQIRKDIKELKGSDK